MQVLNKLLRPKAGSRQIAKERLQFDLVHDRAQISPQLLERLKDEIIAVISRHLEIDSDGVEITLSQSRRESRLQADIPLTRQSRSR